jgi:hypothetical protein
MLRGLFVASNWASEQLKGLDEDVGILNAEDENNEEAEELEQIAFGSIGSEEAIYSRELATVFLSTSLLSSGQYQRAAHQLQSLVENSTRISNLALFLYVYAKYLAGEKIKSQEIDERPKKVEMRNRTKSKKAELGFTDPHERPKNPYLVKLYEKLLPYYREERMDSYLLYIFAVIAKACFEEYGRSPQEVIQQSNEDKLIQPQKIFMQSLAASPWNW